VSAPPQLPPSLAGYRVVSLLGEGTWSSVFHVVREGGRGFTKDLALKVVSPGVPVTADLRRMFEAEARMSARLHHRNIVAVHEFGGGDDRPWIVMDWVEGLDLRRLLRRLRATSSWMPVSAAIELTVQILDGLQHAHTRRGDRGEPLPIIHRDLNPGNVLISQDGCGLLTDFGLARIGNEGDTQPGMTRGTARFMSPEQARGQELDPRSDLFSTGSLLYIMLTGRLPFVGANDREVMKAVARAQFRPVQLGRPQIPAGVARAVHRMMAPSPASRYPTARDAAEALAEAFDAQGANRSARELAQLVRACQLEADEETSEFDGPGGRFGSSLPGVPAEDG
jgi:eukaryotic-like serine/threonine-protein kinase